MPAPRSHERFAASAAVAVALTLGLGAAGCDRGGPKPFAEYRAPKRRPGASEANCESIAKTWPEARRVDGALSLRVGAGSTIEVADAAVLGGPFEAPLALEAPAGLYSVDLVLGKGSAGKNLPLCVHVRLSHAPIASFRELGDVAIDTDVLVLADAASWHRTLGRRSRGPRAPSPRVTRRWFAGRWAAKAASCSSPPLPAGTYSAPSATPITSRSRSTPRRLRARWRSPQGRALARMRWPLARGGELVALEVRLAP
ncbi:MAG: hypothetical protein MUF34_37675 [Polyangiaceae bacterium]|nr:hypothetical protein [Polyangiaceae bacterium]